jgi:hypothetical protein
MKPISAAPIVVTALLVFAINVFAQSESRDDLINQIKTKRADLAAIEKKLLEPSEEDRTTYAEFLRQPDTGLIRLLPRDVYDVVYRTSTGLAINGGGAYYSFTRLTHEYGQGSDIELDHNYLSVGFAGADYGMLLNLGDIPLEEVTIEIPQAQFISTYQPPTLETEVRTEQRRFGAGVLSDSTEYKNRLPLVTNKTYLVRSISFDRSDVLVAFRVIRKDTDGSIILLWKLLKKYPKPVLARNN